MCGGNAALLSNYFDLLFFCSQSTLSDIRRPIFIFLKLSHMV